MQAQESTFSAPILWILVSLWLLGLTCLVTVFSEMTFALHLYTTAVVMWGHCHMTLQFYYPDDYSEFNLIISVTICTSFN